MKLVKGKGSRETGACWMSAIAWYAGQERWTDQAECVAPEIRELCIKVNDLLPSDEERERVIGPHLMAPMGTRTDDPDVTRRRLERIVGFAMQAAFDATGDDRLRPFAGVCAERDWEAAYAAAYANAVNAAAANAAAANAVAANAVNAAAYAANAVNAAAAAFSANAAYAATDAVVAILPLILDLCAIGTPTEVVQVRSLEELPR